MQAEHTWLLDVISSRLPAEDDGGVLCWFQPCVVPASEKVVRAWSLGSSRDMYQSGTPVAMGRPQPGCRPPSRRQRVP